MAPFVANKLGHSDIDTAFARSTVKSKLTNNDAPLSTVPSSAPMTALLASVSNIATSAPSIPSSAPKGCAGKASSSGKVACTIETVTNILQPLAVNAANSGTPTLNFNPSNALKVAAQTWTYPWWPQIPVCPTAR